MSAPIDPRLIERAEKALRRAGFSIEKTETSAKAGTITLKVGVTPA